MCVVFFIFRNAHALAALTSLKSSAQKAMLLAYVFLALLAAGLAKPCLGVPTADVSAQVSGDASIVIGEPAAHVIQFNVINAGPDSATLASATLVRGNLVWQLKSVCH